MAARVHEILKLLGTGAALVALVTLGACGGASAVAQPPQTARVARPIPEQEPVTVDTDAIVAAVAQARGLAPKAKVQFATLSDEDFAASFGAEIAHRRAVRGITSLSVSGGSDASFFLAYYDTRRKKVLLRQKTPEWAKLMDARGLVAHEVEHAIQDQYFDLDAMLSSPEVDVARARHSLIEGDAQAVAAGAVAVLDHLPPKRAIVAATTIVEGLGIDTYVAGGMVDPRMAKLKPAEREEMLFPYRHGAAFVGALVRAGGFALVDRAFAHPPASSAEIIHPEAYLAGRVRVEIPPIPELAGWKASGPKGSFGELALRNVLSTFGIPDDSVRSLAATWRGDSFAALKNDAGHPAYAWSLVVQDEPSAVELGRVLARKGSVLQRGNVLAYVEGFTSEGEARSVASTLLKLPPASVPAPAPPFGALTIPPLPPRLEDRIEHQATLAAGALRVDALGIDLRVPTTWVLKPPNDKRTIIAVLAAPAGALVLALDSTRQSPLVLRAMAGGVVTGFKQAGAPTRQTQEMVPTVLGDALDMHIEFEGGAHVRFVALPMCGAEATLMVTAFERAPNASFEGDVERLVASFDPKRMSASTWCKGIHEERTTDL